jgi:hypothetical protein
MQPSSVRVGFTISAQRGEKLVAFLGLHCRKALAQRPDHSRSPFRNYERQLRWTAHTTSKSRARREGRAGLGLNEARLTLSCRHSNRLQRRHFETGKGLRNNRIVHWQSPTDYAAHHCAQESSTGQSAAEAILLPSVRLIAPHIATHRAVNLVREERPGPQRTSRLLRAMERTRYTTALGHALVASSSNAAVIRNPAQIRTLRRRWPS